MTNRLDYQKISTLVGGYADQKLQAIASAITRSKGYLAGLVLQAQVYADQASASATSSTEMASSAATAASSAVGAYSSFSSTYLGIRNDDAAATPQGAALVPGAWYIRENDGRIRYVTAVSQAGVPVWEDTAVSASPASVLAGGAGIFLALQQTTGQSVVGPVSFSVAPTGPDITNWAAKQLVNASSVAALVNQVSASVNAETARATAAEATLTATKLPTAGGTLTGALTITSGARASTTFTLTNTTQTTGRSWATSVTNDGAFVITNATDGTDRFSISRTGVTTVAGSVVVQAGVTSQTDVRVNRTDNGDALFALQVGGVSRWTMGRSYVGGNYSISRWNQTGTYQDSPIIISSADGSLSLNSTQVNGTLSVTAAVNITMASPRLYLASTTGDANVTIQVGATVRWTAGRSAASATYALSRYNNDGVLVDSPISILETDGSITTNALSSRSSLTAATSVTAARMVTTAAPDGRSILVGGVAYVGAPAADGAVSIRGASSANVGSVLFGNSTKALGVDGTSDTLKYGAATVWTSADSANINAGYLGGLASNAYARITASNIVENNGYIQWAHGEIKCWGTVTILPGAALDITLPRQGTSFFKVKVAANGRAVTVESKTGQSTFRLRNSDTVSATVDWETFAF